MIVALMTALGVFLGNWLVVPLFIKSRTFKDGFAIGIIAAIITFLLCWLWMPVMMVD